MKKKLLCLFTCMAMLLVACTGTRENTSNKEEVKEEKEDITQYIDCVTLGEYKGLELVKEKGKVEKADIQAKINEILKQNAIEKKIKEGKVKLGDTINIDYVGKVDGVPFDNGSAKSQIITLGSSGYIPGFDEGLVGKEVGKEVTINVTFPTDYRETSLQGKAATFDVTINYIQGEEEMPEWTDAFVRTISEYDTTKEYEQQIRVELEQQLKKVEEENFNGTILSKLVEISQFKELPESMVTSRSDALINYYKDFAEQNNIEYADMIKGYFNMDEEQFNAKVKETSENSVKQTLAAFALADKENLIPEGDKRAEKELEIAKENNCETVEKFESAYGEGYALQLVVRNEVLDFIKKNATITEKKVTSEELAKEVQENQ